MSKVTVKRLKVTSTNQLMSDASDDRNYPEKIEHVYTFDIPTRQAPERIDAFITRSIEHATRTRVQRAIERGVVTVNGAPTKSNYKIRPGDQIVVTVMKPPPLQLIPEEMPLEVLYEDDELIVVNKPAGLPVHPGFGNRVGTLINGILWHCGQRDPIDVLKRRESWDEDEEQEESDVAEDVDELAGNDEDVLRSSAIRPGVVHRLDKDTSGVMVIGKTYKSTLALSEQFAARTVSREYVALTWGVIKDDERLVEGEMGRSTRDRKLMSVVERGGKYAATDITVVERYDCATLVTCRLRTGRTHQIRVHLSSIRHPIVGDESYGGREAAFNGIHHLYRQQARAALNIMHRQALHARSLGFDHPVTRQRLEFTSAVPDDMLAAVQAVRPKDVGELPACLGKSDATHS